MTENRWGTKPPTKAEMLTALRHFLYFARIVQVRAVTADVLMNRHGTDRKTTEYELALALQKRAAE